MGNFNRFGQNLPAAPAAGRALVNPSQLFGPALQRPPAQTLSAVSSLLQRGDQIQAPQMPSNARPVLHPLFQQGTVGQLAISLPPRQAQIHQNIVSSGIKEWQSGVRESGGANRGARINQYA